MSRKSWRGSGRCASCAARFGDSRRIAVPLGPRSPTRLNSNRIFGGESLTPLRVSLVADVGPVHVATRKTHPTSSAMREKWMCWVPGVGLRLDLTRKRQCLRVGMTGTRDLRSGCGSFVAAAAQRRFYGRAGGPERRGRAWRRERICQRGVVELFVIHVRADGLVRRGSL